MKAKIILSVLSFTSIWICSAITARIVKTNPFQVEFLSLDIDVDTEFMTVSKTITNKTYLDVNITMHKPIIKGNALVSWIIKISSGIVQYYTTLTKSANTDYCDFFKATSRDPLIKVVFDKVQKHTNYVGCPVNQEQYYLRNFSANNILPMGVFPDGIYKVEASVKHLELQNGQANLTLVINVIN